jgi:hypothetical protein
MEASLAERAGELYASSASSIARVVGPLRAMARVPAALVLAGSCGCTAEFAPYPLPEAPVCAGAVCFEPTDVRVEPAHANANADAIVVTAWRASDAGCEVPHGGDHPLGGTVIEIVIRAQPAIGARVPVVEAWESSDLKTPHVSARAYRIDGRDGRAVSDEQAMTGEATILELDPAARRVRLQLTGRWSSGVEGALVLDWDDTKHPCTQ